MATNSKSKRIASIIEQREITVRQIESSASAYRKCKSMRGIEGANRAKYFLQQKEKAEARLAELDSQLESLGVAETS